MSLVENKLIHFPAFLNIASLPRKEKIEPFLARTKNGSDVYITDADIIKLFSKVFRLSYDVLLPISDGPGRELPNGSWTGAIGMLQRAEADLAIGGLAPTEQRSKVVDFSYPYHFMDVTFVTDKPEHLTKSFAIFSPFSWVMWVGLIILILLMSCLFHVFSRKRYNLAKVVLSTYGNLFEKSIDFRLKDNSIRLLASFWLIFIFLISSSYKSVVLAALSFPSLSGIRSIEDLFQAAQKTPIRCHIRSGSYIYSAFLMSNDEKLKAIGSCVTRTSNLPYDYDEILRNQMYKKVVIAGRSYISKFQKDYFVAKDSFFTGMVAIAIRKNFCCKDALDKFIHLATAAGLFEKFERDTNFFLMLTYYSAPTDNLSQNQSIALDDIFGAFILLIAGNTLPAIILVLEICYSKTYQKAKK